MNGPSIPIRKCQSRIDGLKQSRARHALYLGILTALLGTLGVGAAHAAPQSHFEIVDPASDTPTGAATRSISETLGVVNQILREIFGTQSEGPWPRDLTDQSWQNSPAPFLPRLEALLIRIRSSRFQLALEGASDLRWVGSELFLTEAHGAIGIQIELIDPARTDLKIAIRLSPAFVEVAWIENRLKNRESDPDFWLSAPRSSDSPTEAILLGPSLGFFFEKVFNRSFHAGIQVVVRPTFNLQDIKSGLSFETAEAIFLKIPLKEFEKNLGLDGMSFNSGKLELEIRFSHLRRSEQILDLIEQAYNPQAMLSADFLRDVWEGSLILNWRH